MEPVKICTKCGSENSSNYALVCLRCYHRSRYRLNKIRHKENISRYLSKTGKKEAHSRRIAEWALKNPEAIKAKALRYRTSSKEKCRAKMKRWRTANPDRNAYDVSRRRKSVIIATPKWADLVAIKDFYRNRPSSMQVDHIVPLQGKNVCGLHVHWNFQYLTPSDNSRKKNHI